MSCKELTIRIVFATGPKPKGAAKTRHLGLTIPKTTQSIQYKVKSTLRVLQCLELPRVLR